MADITWGDQSRYIPDRYVKIIDINGNVVEEQLAERVDYDDGNHAIYIGAATAGSSDSVAVWRIKKLWYAGDNFTASTWADGDTKFDNIWDNRTALTYS